jgi:hypothetical protein
MSDEIFCLINCFDNNLLKTEKKYIKKNFIISNHNKKPFSLVENIGINIFSGIHSKYKIETILCIDDIKLICDGEIYNSKELYQYTKITPISLHSCEIIIHLYKQFGINKTLQMLDGVFSFILYDYRILQNDMNTYLFVASDNFAVKPLFILTPRNVDIENNSFYYYGFSNNKTILDFYLDKSCLSEHYCIEKMSPGTYTSFYLTFKTNSFWKMKEQSYYYIPSNVNFFMEPNYFTNLENYFYQSLNKRIDFIKHQFNINGSLYNNTYPHVGCLLTNCYYSIFLVDFLNKHQKKTGITFTPYIIYNNLEELKKLQFISKSINLDKYVEINTSLSEEYEKINNLSYLFISDGINTMIDFLKDKHIINESNLLKTEEFHEIQKLRNNNIIIMTPFLDKFFVDYFFQQKDFVLNNYFLYDKQILSYWNYINDKK